MIAALEGNFGEAQRHYLTAANLNDGSAYAHFCLALLYERMDLFDEALPPIMPLSIATHTTSKPFSMLRVGKWSEAILAFQKSIELDMFRPEAHFNFARALYNQHKADLGSDLVRSLLEGCKWSHPSPLTRRRAKSSAKALKHFSPFFPPHCSVRPLLSACLFCIRTLDVLPPPTWFRAAGVAICMNT